MFSNLSEADKEAFFALLDEYFESRPHLLSGSNTSSADLAAAAAPAAAAFQRTVAQNPQAAANLMASGARSFNKWNNPSSSESQNQNSASRSPADHSSDTTREQVSAGMGRVAAAAAGLSAKGFSRFGNQPAPAAATPSPPPPPPRAGGAPPPPARGAGVPPPAPVSSTRPTPPQAGAAPPPPPPPVALGRRTSSSNSNDAPVRPTPPGLVTTRSIGDVKTTSAGAAFSSILPKRHFGAPPPAPVTIPPAFPRKKSTFGPPPTRVASAPEPEPEPEPEPAEEDTGEWAKVLYDYASSDPGDLPLKERQQVRIIERTSDDWWTGEMNGKQGLFPAAYVELINV